MILSELRTYLATHRRAALTDMAHRFDTDPDAVRGMLDMLVRKGRVRRLPVAPAACGGGGCSTCGGGACGTADHEVFEWVGADANSATGTVSAPLPTTPRPRFVDVTALTRHTAGQRR